MTLIKNILVATLLFYTAAISQNVRYWVGGAGNWGNTSSWSTTSGGGSGASVPTSADIAIVDANSGSSGQVSISLGATSRTIGILSVIGANVTLSGTSGTVNLTIGNGLSGTDLVFDQSNIVINNSLGVGINVSLASGNEGVLRNSQIIISSGSFSNSGVASNLTFSGTSSYVHNINSGSLPLATWLDNATCSITGITSNSYTQSTAAQVFRNFVWNCPNQGTGNRSVFAGSLNATVLGNFIVQNTNGQVLQFSGGGANTNISLNNLSITGGTIRLGGGDVNLSVSGNVFIESGATLDLRSSNNSNFVMVGGESEFTAMGTFSKSSTEANFVLAKNDNATRIVLGSNLDLSIINGHDLRLNNGMIDLNGFDLIYRMPSYQLNSINHTAIITSTSALSNITVIGSDMGGSGLGTLAGVFGLINNFQVSNPSNDNYYYIGNATILGSLNLTGNTNSNFYVQNDNKFTFNNIQPRSAWYKPIQTTNNTNLVFGPTGVYNHDINGGSIISATWLTGSTCSVTGISGDAVGNVQNQQFFNFSWNCPTQSTDQAMVGVGGVFTVLGTYLIQNTGTTNRVVFKSGVSGGPFLINNFSVTGGRFRADPYCGGAYQLSITGDFFVSNLGFADFGVGCAGNNAVILSGASSNISLMSVTGISNLILNKNQSSTLTQIGEVNTPSIQFQLNNDLTIQTNGYNLAFTNPANFIPSGTILGSNANITVTVPDPASGTSTIPGIYGLVNILSFVNGNDDAHFFQGNVTILGNLSVSGSANGSSLNINSPHSIYINKIQYASQMPSSGASSNGININGRLIFGPNSIYNHNVNGGSIPSSIWQTGSICSITGITNTAFNGGFSGQVFDNLIFNNTGQSGTIHLGLRTGQSFTVNGMFGVYNTNGQILQFPQFTNENLGDFVLNNVSITSSILYAIHNAPNSGSDADFNIFGDFFLDANSRFSPYAGTGYNVNITFSGSSSVLNALGTFTGFNTMFVNKNTNSYLRLNTSLSSSNFSNYRFPSGILDLNGTSFSFRLPGDPEYVNPQPGIIFNSIIGSNLEITIPDIGPSFVQSTPGIYGTFNNFTFLGTNDAFELIGTPTIAGEYFQSASAFMPFYIRANNYLYINGLWKSSNTSNIDLQPLSLSNLYFGPSSIFHGDFASSGNITVPTGGTWLDGSTVSITGQWAHAIANTRMQSYSNFIIDCPLLTTNINLSGGALGDFFNVRNNFIVYNTGSTGSVGLRNSISTGVSLHNISILGGNVQGGGSGSVIPHTVSGNLFVANGARLNLAVNSVNQDVIFTGSSQSAVSALGTLTGISRYVVSKNNLSTASGLHFAVNTTLTAPISITSGLVSTGSSILQANTIVGASQSRGWVVGNLAKTFATGSNVSQTYQIGTSQYYTPLSVQLPIVSTGGALVAQAIASDHPQLASAVCLSTDKGVNVYWQINTLPGNTLSPTNYTPSFTYNAANLKNGSQGANQFLAAYDGSWNYFSGIPTQSDFINFDGSQLSGTTTVLGDFVLAETISASISGTNTICASNPSTTQLTLAGLSSITWSVPSGYDIVGASSNTELVFSVSGSGNTGLITASGFNPCTGTYISLFYPITVNSAPAYPTTSGLSLGYLFSGSNSDAAGSNTASLQNSPGYTFDRFGNPNSAIQLNGTNQFVTNASSFTLSNNFTYSIWIRTSSTSGGQIVGRSSAQSSNTSSPNYDRMLVMNPSGQIGFGVNNGSLNFSSTSNSYNDGKWHHVAVSYANPGGSWLYVDGLLVASSTLISSQANVGSYLRLGNATSDNIFSTTVDFLAADLDDFYYFNRVLTENEIKLLQGITVNNPFCTSMELSAPLFFGANYTLTGPSGFTSSSRSNTISGLTSANSGIYTASVSNSCGTMPTLMAPVTYQESKISGENSVCFGSTTATYSVNGLNTYTWSVPYGYTITSGNNTSTITVTFNGAATNNNITVSGNGYCTGGAEIFLRAITVNGLYVNPTVSSAVFAYYLDGNANDATSNGFNATLYNSPSFTLDRNGNVGSALATLSASNHYMHTNPTFASPNNYSFSLWIKTSSSSTLLVGLDDETGDSPGAIGHDREIYLDRFGRVAFRVNSNANIINTTNSYNDNNWHHIVGSLSPNGIKIYVDGELQASNPLVTSGIALTGVWRFGKGHLCCYTNLDNNGQNVFEGSMDDIAYFNRELGPDEVRYLYGLKVSRSPVCNGIITMDGPNFAKTNASWSGPNGFSSSTPDATITGVTFSNSGTYVYSYTNTCGTGTIPITIRTNSTSATTASGAGGINGPSAVCAAPFSSTYAIVTPNTSITGYVWSVPSGFTITSGQGTSAVGITFPSTFAGGTLTVIGTNECGNTQPSTLTILLDASVNSWRGSNSDWNLGSNWCSGVVPTSGTSALIPFPSSSYPVVTVAGTINNLTVASFASVTINNNGALAVYGNLINSGNINQTGSGALAFVGGSQSVSSSGNISAQTLSFTGSGTKSLSNTISVTQALQITGTPIAVQNTGTLVLKSTGTTTGQNAYIGEIPSGSSIAGDVVIEKYMTGTKGYRYFSAPVANVPFNQLQSQIHLTGPTSCASCDPSVSRIRSIQYYNEPALGPQSSQFPAITTLTSTFETGRGYQLFIRGPRSLVSVDNISNNFGTLVPFSLSITGVPNQGNISLPVSFSASSFGMTADGWNLVGNPYASPVNWAAGGWTKTNILPIIYVYKPDASSGFGSYYSCAYDEMGDTWIANDGRSNCQILESHQAFMVKATATGVQLQITESCKTIPGTSIRYNFKESESMHSITLSVIKDNANDQALALIRPYGSNTYDPSRDALKWQNQGLNISILSNDSLSISMDNISASDTCIPLRFSSNSTGQHILKVRPYEVDADLYLIDTYTKDTLAVQSDLSYSFDILSDPLSKNPFRFHIRMVKSSLTLDQFYTSTLSGNDALIEQPKTDGVLRPNSILHHTVKFDIVPNPVENQAPILLSEGMENAKASISLLNSQGIILYASDVILQHSLELSELGQLPTGMYLLIVNTLEGSRTLKFLKR